MRIEFSHRIIKRICPSTQLQRRVLSRTDDRSGSGGHNWWKSHCRLRPQMSLPTLSRKRGQTGRVYPDHVRIEGNRVEDEHYRMVRPRSHSSFVVDGHANIL